MMTKDYEFENERLFNGCKIIERGSSMLAIAKKEIILPSKKGIILPDQATSEGKKLFDAITNGSLIL